MTHARSEMERRQFLQVICLAGAGLLVGCSLQAGATPARGPQPTSGNSGREIAPNAWIRIGRDDSVTVMVNHSEMGQGIHSGLAMIVAEELEADWAKVRTEPASMDPVY
ncbi:MAG: molybdopterin cofactor-binding domain-containing protein, partial [Pseudomonadota bacterium]